MLSLSFSNHEKQRLYWNDGWKELDVKPCVYIPVKEMLANAPGFLSLYKSRYIHFEEIYADILIKAFEPRLRGPIAKDRKKLLEKIEKIITGEVNFEGEEFYLKAQEGNIEFTLLAEGMRKLGLLWLLIQNGTLLRGAKLFWDEPEANLNPSMLDMVVEILLELQRNGVQIFIATHNYVLLKEFDLQKGKKDNLKFFHLEKDAKTAEMTCHSGGNYTGIVPNKISEAYTDIYNKEVKRSLGGTSK